MISYSKLDGELTFDNFLRLGSADGTPDHVWYNFNLRKVSFVVIECSALKSELNVLNVVP